MTSKTILSVKPLGFMWPVSDPFLFCVHHEDHYPKGNDVMGPAASLQGRNIGNDFTVKDGWRMYHGETVPGFPAHPHRGFETVTAVMQGIVDHSDSYGQAGRYGNGDVQWMTAGKGLQHCEMFPLLNKEKENPAELFQIWLNLPKSKKYVEPHFKMLWNEDIPVLRVADDKNKNVEIRIIAGRIGSTAALKPAPDSWAAEETNEVAIWIIKMEPGSKWAIPPAHEGINRNLYFYTGSAVTVDGMAVRENCAITLQSNSAIGIENGDIESRFLLLQGKPINEPVVQYGPFVMNSQGEIKQAFTDFQETQFGGWPWDRTDYVHPVNKGRFARYADGTEEVRS
ncbi:MAG: pirin family protein [Ignavibacteriales bacterium]|nr:pirin family protein [Ignavibacteriales bacterium]